jgi:hypothetical protein
LLPTSAPARCGRAAAIAISDNPAASSPVFTQRRQAEVDAIIRRTCGTSPSRAVRIARRHSLRKPTPITTIGTITASARKSGCAKVTGTSGSGC